MKINTIEKLSDNELQIKLISFIDEQGAFILSTDSYPYIQEKTKRMFLDIDLWNKPNGKK